jgi:hypothetical protein
VTDLMTAITGVLDSSDFPARRSTYIAPERVVVWRIVSKDPDEIVEHFGTLVSETPQLFNVMLDGDTFTTSFPKTTPSGVTVYRMQRLPS